MEKQNNNQANQPNHSQQEASMEDKSSQKNHSQQEANTSTMTEGEKYWERLKNLEYNNSRIGQAFIVFGVKPPPEIMRSLNGKTIANHKKTNMNNKEKTCTANGIDLPLIVDRPSVVMDEAVKALLENNTEQCTIVHCRVFSRGNRIWPQTVLVEDTGSTRKLLKAFNISLYPEWTRVRTNGLYHHFTLVFEGLGKACRSFYLDERIPERCGFYTEKIARNSSDVYEAEVLVKF